MVSLNRTAAPFSSPYPQQAASAYLVPSGRAADYYVPVPATPIGVSASTGTATGAARPAPNGRDLQYYNTTVKNIIAEANEMQQNKQFAAAASRYEEAVALLRRGEKQFAVLPPVVADMRRTADQYATTAAYLKDRKPDEVVVHKDPTGRAVVAPQTESSSNEAARAVQACTVAETPEISWDDIIGLEEVKASVREAVEMPIKFGELFDYLKLQPWSGILLFGPPGTGKTMLAQAAAHEMNCTFFSVRASNILSNNFGASEKIVAELFSQAERRAPAIIYLDEVDAVLRARSDKDHEAMLRIKTELFMCMQGFKANSGVLVIGATNCPDKLDDAGVRRFAKRIWVGPPDERARYLMFKRKLEDVPHALAEQNFRDLARRTEGWTGNDIAQALQEAKFIEFRRVVTSKAFVRNGQGALVPCPEGTPYSIPLPSNTRNVDFAATLTFDQVSAAVAAWHPAVGPEAMKKYKERYDESLQAT